MSATPKVSVVMATFNGERYLAAQLDTIYAQTWPNLEVVVSDDASSDGTEALLESYATRHGLRFVAQQERLGLVGNFERALTLATGEWVALSDQDDVWKPEKITRMMAAATDAANPRTLVYCNPAETLEEDGRVHYELAHEPVIRFERAHGSGRPAHLLLAENWVVSHTMLLRRTVLERALPFPAGLRYHDGWLALAACSEGEILFLDECLQTYRRHGGSFTFQTSSPQRRKLAAWLSGASRAQWQRLAEEETRRLEAAQQLPGWSDEERARLNRLRTYYRAGLEPGWRWRSFLAGCGVSGWFVTKRSLSRRVMVPFTPVLASR